MLRLRIPLLALSAGLLLAATGAHAFSSGATTCVAGSAATGHGPSQSGTGGFVVTVLRAGTPTSTVVPGETVQVQLTRGSGSHRGFLLRAQLGSTAGTGVTGLTPRTGDKVESTCSPSGSGVSHANATVVTTRIVDWTVPGSLNPGDTVIFSAVGVVSLFEWYGATTAITTSVGVEAAPSVPALGLLGGAVATGGLLLVAKRRLTRA